MNTTPIFPDGLVTPIDIRRLKEKYGPGNEFEPSKAHHELQALFNRFKAVNLLSDRFEKGFAETGQKGEEYTHVFAQYLEAVQRQQAALLRLMGLLPQAKYLKSGTPEYHAIAQKGREANKEFKQAEKDVKKYKKKTARLSDAFFKSFEQKQARFNFFGFRYKFKLGLTRAALTGAAIVLTLGLDRLGMLFDEKHEKQSNSYLYHACFFILFAVIDRYAITPLEERISAVRARSIFHDGIEYLSGQVQNKIDRDRKTVQEYMKKHPDEF